MNTFIHTSGANLVDGNGEKFFIRGTNLGNWLNPEGYMFAFGKCNAGHFIDVMFRELVGPEETRRFWKARLHPCSKKGRIRASSMKVKRR